LDILLVTAPYVLATKIEAFRGRGENDYLMSHDLGDIIALVDGRQELAEEVRAELPTLRHYLRDQLVRWLADDRFISLAIPGHLPYEADRSDIVLERLRTIAGM
jgi:hypothetical protein